MIVKSTVNGLVTILTLFIQLFTLVLAAASKVKDPHNLSTLCGKEYPLSPQGLIFAEKVYGMSGGGAIRRVNSAQHQALCWMLLEDKFKLNASDTLLLERYALVTLYAATNGSSGNSWLVKNGWLEGKGSHCNWFGVKCYRNGRVKSLNLAINGLSGSLPKEIGLALNELKSLYLYSNELRSSIPPSIFNLKKLRYLHLHANLFQGTIPADLSNLVELRELYLYGNDLTGTIPNSVSQLNRLEVLDLYNNYLQGSINQRLFDNMKSLEEVYLDDNDLTGVISKDSAICKRKLNEFSSDCRGGSSAEVKCDCCTICCHDKADPKCINTANTKKGRDTKRSKR